MTPRNFAIVTICSNNYLALAKVLLQSARRHHPEATFYLCLADHRLPDDTLYPADCHLVMAEELHIPQFRQFAFRYNILEFNTAIKPFLFLHLLQAGHDAILYFDPDIELFAPLHGAVAALAGEASFVLTPHLLQPAATGAVPDDLGIMRAGAYNLGFLGVGATAEAAAVLRWLGKQLLYQCVGDQERGLFVDQRFFDLVPSFARKVEILRDATCNVAYWNLSQRQLTQREEDGAWVVDGEPLTFFHFSGFNCADDTQLSKHSKAFRRAAISPALRAIMRHYAAQVIGHGREEAGALPYGYGYFASGAAISPHVRRVFRERCPDWLGDPFENFESHLPTLDEEFPPAKTRDELAQEIEALYASSSWRITQPLRVLRQGWKRRPLVPPGA